MNKFFKLFCIVLCVICASSICYANEVYSFKKVVHVNDIDTTSRYVIASVIGDSIAYVWNGKDETKGYVEFDIVDSLNITYTDAIAPVMIQFGESTNKIYSKISGGEDDGKYFSGVKNSNKVNFTKDECEIDFDSIGNFILTSNTSVMRFNAASNNLRFRFFKSETHKNQKEVQLYRLIENGGIAVSIDNTVSNLKVVKNIVNGMLVIEKNGVKYNALGALLSE